MSDDTEIPTPPALLDDTEGYRKVTVAELQLANMGIPLEQLLHGIGIDPTQPYSVHPHPDKAVRVFVQPPWPGELSSSPVTS
jgi:hypothetical protein